MRLKLISYRKTQVIEMKKYFLPLMFAGVLATISSCKDDVMTPATGDNQDNYTEGAGYVAFNVRTDLTTRAPGDDNEDVSQDGGIFNPGSRDEYALSTYPGNHLALYFNEKGDYFGSSTLQKYEGPANGTNNNTERIYSYVNKYRYADALTADYVLLLLNMDPEALLTVQRTVEQNQGIGSIEKVLSLISSEENPGYCKLGDETFFSMTSSLYFSDKEDRDLRDPETAEPDGKGNINRIAAPVNSTLYETLDDALKNPLRVYVERIAAKHEVTFQKGDDNSENRYYDPQDNNNTTYKPIQYIAEYPGSFTSEAELDYPSAVEYHWIVYVAGWDLNALERNAFYFKNINQSGAEIFNGAYNDVDNFFPTWNFGALHRSYWAVDQHYNAGGGYDFGSDYYYPTQYRSFEDDPDRVTEGDDTDYKVGDSNKKSVVDKNGNVHETSLKYISYKNITDLKTDATYKYSLENTFSDELGLKDYGPYRYGTHVLLAAQLVVPELDKNYNQTSKSGLLSDIKDKYQAYDYWFGDAESYIRYAYRRMMRSYADGAKQHKLDGVEGSFTALDMTLYYKKQDGEYQPIDFKEADAYFKLGDANIVHGDGRQVLVPADEKTQFALRISKIITGTDDTKDEVQVSFIDIDTEILQEIIYANTETVQHFANGSMYYAIPVQHNFGQSNNPNTLTSVAKNQTYELGQFGVVRNHWYRFNINTIGSIGIPVDNPEQPIIPDPEEEYYIAFDIRIIPWHIIDNGDVDLK